MTSPSDGPMTASEHTELLPALARCPFCRSAEVRPCGSMSWTFVRCDNCKAQGPFFHHGGPTTERRTINRAEAEAIAAWNRRAVPDGAEPVPVAWPGGDFVEYSRVHNIAISAYEAAIPPDYRYSAAALRKAVDAAITAALTEVGNG